MLNSYKKNILLHWNKDATTRALPNGQEVEVVVHEDESLLFLKEGGNFVSHLMENDFNVPPIRSFTCDTIPFSVSSQKDFTKLNLQDILI